MKTAFRMLVSTAVTAAILYVLRLTHVYFTAESMLGPTVDQVVERCLQVLAVVCVLLYLRCWVSLLIDAVRRRRAARKTAAVEAAAEPSPSVRLSIAEEQPARLYDREEQETTADTHA